jgi:hypothetical protein
MGVSGGEDLKVSERAAREDMKGREEADHDEIRVAVPLERLEPRRNAA